MNKYKLILTYQEKPNFLRKRTKFLKDKTRWKFLIKVSLPKVKIFCLKQWALLTAAGLFGNKGISLGITTSVSVVLYTLDWNFEGSWWFWRLITIQGFSSIMNYYVNLAWISYIILPNDSWTLASNLIKESKSPLFIFKKCVWRNSTGHSHFINLQVNNSHSVHYITCCLQAKFTPGMLKLGEKSPRMIRFA